MPSVPAWLYQQYDADYSLDIPAEGFQGWRQVSTPLNLQSLALIVMHAWNCGTREQYPGWYRAVEYIPRANAILREVFPPLLSTVRQAGVPVIHVTSGDYYVKAYPGYERACELAGTAPQPSPMIARQDLDQGLTALHDLYGGNGPHNKADIQAGFERLDFPTEARPLADELIVKDDHQLDACCRHVGATHLLYVGFALNWCLLMSAGSMLDMRRRGYICSVVREATTAVENRESARTEAHKEEGLWRVARAFGFVYDLPDLLAALSATADRAPGASTHRP